MNAVPLICRNTVKLLKVSNYCTIFDNSINRKLHLTSILWRKRDFSCGEKDEVPSAMSSKYETFSEENAPIILDIAEERKKIIKPFEEEQIYNEFHGINLERGIRGVFEIEEIVYILKREKAQDIFVAQIPQNYRYADYLVVATGRSNKHKLAITEFIRKVYKKKRNENDKLPMIEGRNSTSWTALDMENIVLHIFTKTARELYDLETLWSVGKKYDPQLQTKDASYNDLVTNYTHLLASLTPNRA